MKGKIGLITIYHVPNFGSVLQTYATQQIIRKLGYECIILQYKYPNEWHYAQGRSRPTLKSRIGHLLGLKSTHRKANKLNKFRRNFFNFSHQFANIDAMKKEAWSEYKAVIVGSDQVWNARFTLADSAFMLSFLPEGVHRLSIASSFATKSLPINTKEKYRKYLSHFNAISVREQNGINIIKNELEIECNPKVLLDPTLLLDRKEWLSLIPRSKFIKRKKYILFYMLTYAFEPRPYIFDLLRYLTEKYGYEILALEGYTPAKQANNVIMQDKTDSDITEFIDLFANADMVVTSSFHGTAFAANFGIPLISVIPNDKGDDRQYSLLKQLGLEQCIVPIGTEFDSINPYYDVNKANINLSQTRQDCLEWINDNL